MLENRVNTLGLIPRPRRVASFAAQLAPSPKCTSCSRAPAQWMRRDAGSNGRAEAAAKWQAAERDNAFPPSRKRPDVHRANPLRRLPSGLSSPRSRFQSEFPTHAPAWDLLRRDGWNPHGPSRTSVSRNPFLPRAALVVASRNSCVGGKALSPARSSDAPAVTGDRTPNEGRRVLLNPSAPSSCPDL